MKLKLLTVLIFMAASAAGHDLYLTSTPFHLPKPGNIKLSLFLAEAFPGKIEKWRGEKTADFQMVGPNGSRELGGKQESDPEVELNAEGTYLLAWSSTPSYITIDSKHFEEYVLQEGYKNVLEDRKRKGKSNAEGSERYSRNLKTFVQVGERTTDNFRHELGTRLEIIPMRNPYALKVGEELSVQLLFKGKGIPNARIMATFDGFSLEHDVYAQTVQTDAKGIAKIKITKPGIWMIRANQMVPLTDDPKAEWESFWTNCVFQIDNNQ
jgi:uncharacterized GH25 family protein